MYSNKEFLVIEETFYKKINSHAYIFYTNNFDLCQKDVYKLIQKIFNIANINLLTSDLIVISKTDKKNILKEDMLDLDYLPNEYSTDL